MKTLYVTDLDGTLLTSEEIVSAYTAETINRLVADGMLFSYATGRPYITASQLTSRLITDFPVVLYNGAFIAENKTGKIIKSNFIQDTRAHNVIDIITSAGVYPLVYHYNSGNENISWVEKEANEEMKENLHLCFQIEKLVL